VENARALGEDVAGDQDSPQVNVDIAITLFRKDSC
jgi:hypothetical protein